jgi:plasmid stabilization system protein ParE
VARVEVSERALTDLERLFDFIAEEDPTRARMQLLSVRRAFELLADHPLLGREAEGGPPGTHPLARPLWLHCQVSLGPY